MPPKSDKYHCTSSNCHKHIKTSFDANLHPLLQVLVCFKCYNEYQTGDFSKFENGVDENGDDNYCRWCVDGGDLFTCGNSEKEGPDKCHYSFCKDCIVVNCPSDRVLTSADEPDIDWKWTCYACKPSPIAKLQKVAREAILKLSQRDMQPRLVAVDKTVESETSTNKTTVIDVESEDREPIEGSAVKKRRTDTTTPAPLSKETPNEKERDKERDREKARHRDEERDREKDRDREKRDRDKNKDKEVIREPEARNLPPGIEVPRPAKTTLRNTKNSTSNMPKPQAGTPLSMSSTKIQFDSTTKPHSLISTTPKRPPQSTPNPTTVNPGLTTPKPQNGPKPQSTQKHQPAQTPISVPEASVPKPTVSQQAPPQQKQQQQLPPQQPPQQQATSQRQPSSQQQPHLTTTPASIDAKSKLKQVSIVQNGKVDATTHRVSANFSGLHLHKAGPAKQLKASNERITPSTRIRLSERDLKEHLDNLGKVKNSCVKEIDIKFQSIFEMMTSKTFSSLGGENKVVVKRAIEDLEKPLQDFQTMLVKLKSLNSSQNQA